MSDRERLEALFAEHARAVRAYALRRCDAAAADDVVSDVFVVACRRLQRLPGPASISPRAYNSALRRCSERTSPDATSAKYAANRVLDLRRDPDQFIDNINIHHRGGNHDSPSSPQRHITLPTPTKALLGARTTFDRAGAADRLPNAIRAGHARRDKSASLPLKAYAPMGLPAM